MLISNNIILAEKIARDVWENAKNYSIVKCDNTYDRNFLTYIRSNKSIIITSGASFEIKNINDFIKYCKKNKILPIFITDKENRCNYDFPHTMYTAVEEIFPDSCEYFHDYEDNQTYNDFKTILMELLW